jgi:hypothetical protein
MAPGLKICRRCASAGALAVAASAATAAIIRTIFFIAILSLNPPFADGAWVTDLMICDPRQRLRIAIGRPMCAKSRSRPRGRARPKRCDQLCVNPRRIGA